MDNVQPLAAAAKTTKMCFVAGTLVWAGVVADAASATAADSAQPADHAPAIERVLRPIESIAEGDLVWARCEQTGEQGWKPVVDTFTTRPTELWTLEFEVLESDAGAGAGLTAGSTDTITATAPHPFYVVGPDEFVPMADLQPGDLLLLADGRGLARVLGLRPSRAPPGESFTTYNFEVQDFHTYFVGGSGVWVHNAGKTCDELFSLYTRFRGMNNKTPEEAWRLMMKMYGPGGAKAGQYSDVALGTAVESALRTDVYGDELLKLWTKGARESPGHNMFMHFKDHVLNNKSGIPGGEFPTITNPIDYVKYARSFIESTGDDVVTWFQKGNKIVLHKTDARFAVQVVNTGEMRTFFRANPKAGTLLDWARQRGYDGPAF